MLTKVFQRNLTQWGHIKTPIKPHPNPRIIFLGEQMPKYLIEKDVNRCFST